VPEIPASLRQTVADRAQGCCEYCKSQERFAAQAFSVEHITPRCKGGQTTADNLAFACQGCNNHKYTKTEALDPVNGDIAPLFHPRRQHWGDHFVWADDLLYIVGLTPSGRATVEALQLNREGLVNLRRILRDAGEHPP
jgi:hypothetical protein